MNIEHETTFVQTTKPEHRYTKAHRHTGFVGPNQSHLMSTVAQSITFLTNQTEQSERLQLDCSAAVNVWIKNACSFPRIVAFATNACLWPQSLLESNCTEIGDSRVKIRIYYLFEAEVAIWHGRLAKIFWCMCDRLVLGCLGDPLSAGELP